MREEYPVGFGELLQATFRYEPGEGVMYRKQRDGSERPITTKHPKGHWLVSLSMKGKNFMIPAARVAFYLHEGRWPDRLIYRNGDNSDMRWENLTEVDKGEIRYERVPILRESRGSNHSSGSRPTHAPAKPVKERDYYGEMMKLVEQQQAWKHRVSAATPLESEACLLFDRLEEENRAVRWKEGLLTGGDLRDATLFREAASQTLPYMSEEECFVEYKKRKLAGREKEGEKLEHDYLFTGFVLHCLAKNFISREFANTMLSGYTWDGKPFHSSFPATRDRLVAEFIRSRGFASIEEARAAAEQRLLAEEAERFYLLREEQEATPAWLWLAQQLTDQPAAPQPTAKPCSSEAPELPTPLEFNKVEPAGDTLSAEELALLREMV